MHFKLSTWAGKCACVDLCEQFMRIGAGLHLNINSEFERVDSLWTAPLSQRNTRNLIITDNSPVASSRWIGHIYKNSSSFSSSYSSYPPPLLLLLSQLDYIRKYFINGISSCLNNNYSFVRTSHWQIQTWFSTCK